MSFFEIFIKGTQVEDFSSMNKPNSFKISRLFSLAAILCCLVISSFAQTSSGRIQGTITDQAGGVVAGATIKIIQVDTNREITVQSNNEGNFVALSLLPGRYSIEVAQSNFKTSKQEITLQTQQTAVLNFSLETGGVSEIVNVDTEAPLVDSATSTLGDVITGRRITELPLNGRNVLELARLSPGVTQGVRNGFATGVGGNAETYRNGNTGGAALSVNGQRTQANNFMIDGVDNNESLVNTIAAFPSADAVEEFKVETSVAKAESGRGGGAVINTTMKSGKNNYSGSSFLFVRNDNFDANDGFDRSLGRERKEFRRGQFGATLGGPLPLPNFGEGGPMFKSGKDKLFFFFSYEGQRQFLPVGSGLTTVPTAKMRNGDFSETLAGNNSDGVNVQLIDPLNGNNIAGNRIDLVLPGRINQAGLNYLRAFPLPNVGTNRIKDNYFWIVNQEVTANTFDGKVDWNVNDSNQFNVRINWSDWKQEASSRFPLLPAGFGTGSNPSENRSISLGWNSTLSPTMTNELRVSASRFRYAYEPPLGDQPVSRNLGFIYSNPDPLRYGGVVVEAYGDRGEGNLEYTGDGGAYTVPQNTYQISDSLTWVKGNHVLKFGASVIRRQVNIFQGDAAKGGFKFYSGAYDSYDTSSRWTTADMLIGFAQEYRAGSSAGMIGTRNWENGFFIQDDWKVSSKLTLNLGLRYDILTMPTEAYGRQANFDLNTGRLVLAKDSNDALVDTDWGNIGPRAGFAYDMSGKGKSVIRGGYGLFYYLDRGGVGNQLTNNPPYKGTATYSAQNNSGGYRITFSGMGPAFSRDNVLATAALPTLPASQNIDLNNLPNGLNVLAILPDSKTSRTHQFNIQFEQEVWKDTALSVGYVGNRGRNLSIYYGTNNIQIVGQSSTYRPFPNLGNVNVRDDTAISSYDSLQLKLERRFTAGWQYQAAYTYSLTKDVSNGAFDNQYGFADVTNVEKNFGKSGINFPHVFTFSSIYEIPYGKGRKYGSDINGFVDALIGGWQITPLLRIQSGNPFDIRDDQGNLVDLTGADPYSGNDSPYLNPAAFVWVPKVTGTSIPSRIGNMERNSLQQPLNWSLNMGISKNFRISEKSKIQLRAQAYNLTNTPQRRGLDTWLPSGTFGKWYETYNFSARQLEFGARLEF